MKIVEGIQTFLSIKRSRPAIWIYAAGLLALPSSFAASVLNYHLELSWRPYLDYFEYAAVAFTLACFVVAPFIPKMRLAYKLICLLLSAEFFVLYLFFCAVIGAMFGLEPN